MVCDRRCLFLLLTFLTIASRIRSQIDGTDDRNDAEQIWEIEGVELKFPKFDSRQFSYTDLERITNNSEKKIGSGAYGNVYLGSLEDGVQVAVKMYNQSCAEAANEFLAEAGSLTRLRQKYLVALIGYCISRSNCMALVYEYVPEGDLYWKLRDRKNPLSWRQRLQIAYESALGLEYLHKACNPPVIHRDIKTSNILLTADLQAKIADFGISRAFNNTGTNYNYVPRILGTVGYLDPEYHATGKITLKTDVYSFGVVLLEIITGKGPINVDKGGSDLVQWVRQKLSGGDIESIVHSRMQGKYNMNSVRKVMHLASKCTKPKTSERPMMTEVVAELKESLDLEVSIIEEMDYKTTKYKQLNNGCEPGQHLDFKNVGFWLPLGIGQCYNLYYSKAKI